jgi:ClpP class serine protease
MANSSTIFWIFLLFLMFTPYIRQRILNGARLKLIRELEIKRGSRVITLIHRQEMMSFLGIPFVRYISIDDSEQVLRAIRLTPDDMPIDLILHTPGGLVLATEQIACALLRHKARVTVFIPHYAMSGGTMITLAADQIAMDEHAVLGPIDPQLGEYPVASILKVIEEKEKKDIDDKTLILADVGRKAMRQVRRFVTNSLREKMSGEKAGKLARKLTEGRWTHDYPITSEMAKKMELPVSTEMPDDIYRLMELYPQTAQRRPSVSYIPVPYQKEPTPSKRR